MPQDLLGVLMSALEGLFCLFCSLPFMLVSGCLESKALTIQQLWTSIFPWPMLLDVVQILPLMFLDGIEVVAVGIGLRWLYD